MNNILLLLSGKNGSGKTTMAKYLEKYCGFKILSIADTLKENFMDLYDIKPKELKENKNFFRYKFNKEDVKKISKDLYNRINRSFPDKEELDGLVEFSINILDLFGKEYWVKSLINKNQEIFFQNKTKIVIDDLRRELEIKFLKKNLRRRKIITIRIDCKLSTITDRGYTISDSILETELDNYNFDYIINNDESLKKYYERIKQLVVKLSLGT